MKVAILAGGHGARLSDDGGVQAKPMVHIGDRPILWHLMRYFGHFGLSHFVIALGERGDDIKRFFVEYHSTAHSMRVDLGSGEVGSHQDGDIEKWTVDLIETGRRTQTGGRIARLRPHLEGGTFLLAWGDGLTDLDVNQLVAFHESHGRLITVAAVHPPPRFGQLELDGPKIVDFTEKPIESSWINGALFVCEPGIFDYIDGDGTQFEREPMRRLAAEGELMAFRHDGFWQCMDTLRDRRLLSGLWESGKAPWKVWDAGRREVVG